VKYNILKTRAIGTGGEESDNLLALLYFSKKYVTNYTFVFSENAFSVETIVF